MKAARTKILMKKLVTTGHTSQPEFSPRYRYGTPEKCVVFASQRNLHLQQLTFHLSVLGMGRIPHCLPM